MIPDTIPIGRRTGVRRSESSFKFLVTIFSKCRSLNTSFITSLHILDYTQQGGSTSDFGCLLHRREC